MNSQSQPKIVSMFQQDQELVTKEIHEVQKSNNKTLVSRKRSATLQDEIVKKVKFDCKTIPNERMLKKANIQQKLSCDILKNMLDRCNVFWGVETHPMGPL